MRRDPTEFRKRFAAWKEGKLPYEAGLPKYADGKGEIVTDYPIPFVKDKVVKLTDAGLATGAVLSTNLLDSIADNAYRAGLDLLTALGLATKESTLGNPTDDRSMRTLLSALRQKELTDHLLEVSGLSYDLLFGLHINRGDIVRGQELINWYKDENNIEHKPSPPLYTTHPDRKSVIQKAFEFYKQHPDKYNPGQKNYQRLVDKRGAEVMGSPEVQKWLKERNIKKAVGNFNRVNPLLKESKFNLPAYKNGKPVLVNGNPTNALFNSDGTFTDDITKVFDDFYVTPSGVTTKYGSHTDKNWDRYKQLESFYKYRDLLTGKLKGEPGLEIVSPEFDVVSAARAGLSILKPKSKLLQKSFADVNNSIDIAKEPYINIGTTSFDIAKESPTIHELNKYARMLDPDGKGNRISGPYASIKKFLESPAYRKRLEKYYRDKGSSIITQNVAPDDRISELLYNIETAKLKVMPKGKLVNAEGEIKDAYGMYDPNSHSIQIASDAVLRNTPEHEMWHAARRARAYLDNAKYKMRVRSLSDLNYYGDISEQEVRVLDTLREMQESGLDINNLTDDQIWNFFYETPIDSHGTNVQSLIDNYWYDDVKNALRNFKGLSIPITMGIGYTKLKPIQTMKSE